MRQKALSAKRPHAHNTKQLLTPHYCLSFYCGVGDATPVENNHLGLHIERCARCPERGRLELHEIFSGELQVGADRGQGGAGMLLAELPRSPQLAHVGLCTRLDTIWLVLL